jgi:hypothetical protein
MAKSELPPCGEMMKSEMIPDHVHTCDGHHDEDNCHWCPECRRWWWDRNSEPRLKGK